MKPITSLYLASKSQSRRSLLELAQIPFITIEQDADESLIDLTLPIEELVALLAVRKMEAACLPSYQQEDTIFVLAADTLAQDIEGTILRKPQSYQDAVKSIKQLRGGATTVSTAFCLDKKQYTNGRWESVCRIVRAVSALCVVSIPDAWIDDYLSRSEALDATGAIAIEGFGMQFVEYIEGSYSTILGLPLYEVHQALTELDFFSS
jgi:septum formation protein